MIVPRGAYLTAIFVIATAHASTAARADPQLPRAGEVRDGRHDFDLRFGDWHVQHRKLKDRLASSHEWIEFDGTLSLRPLMGGLANVGDNVFNLPGGTYRGVSLRAYDPRTGLWAVWWLDGRNPLGELDPPMKGRFDNGDGMFYGDDTFKGKPIRVRIIWSHATSTSAHWEQAYSADGGKTWETNWISDFRRAS